MLNASCGGGRGKRVLKSAADLSGHVEAARLNSLVNSGAKEASTV
jgi:pyruvate carboxylase